MSQSQAPLSDDVRCHCGKLMARWEQNRLVIKCARCGRFVTIHHSAIRGTPPAAVDPMRRG